MKSIKKFSAILLALAVSFSLTACHPKNEVAITAKDKTTGTSLEITSAQYLYALTSAVLEAQSNINEANSDTTITDYTDYKVVETDDNGTETKTKYEKWVNERTEELLREYAAVMIKQKDLKLELDDSTLNTVEQYANMYWQYYYQPTFEKNGVSDSTFLKMFKQSYYENEYFLSVYDTDGTDPVDEKEIKETFYDSYVLTNMLTVSLKSEDSDDTEDDTSSSSDDTALSEDDAKRLLEGYKTRIEKGEKFSDILADYNTTYKPDDESASSDPETVLGSEETNSASDYFTKAFKMKKNALQIITNDDKTEMALIQKSDIKADESNYDNYREQVLYQIKNDEFEENLTKYAKSLKFTYETSATKRLTADKIDTSSDS